ncbi:MAG: hypothetical protein AB7G75_05635 [Candidatus Binatia bacterium]
MWTSLHPALGLAKSLSRREAFLPIYYGLWVNVMLQGRVAESLDWANETLAMAEASDDSDLLLVAHQAACCTYFYRGDVTQSHVHGDRVLVLYSEEQHRHLADLTNQDSKSVVGLVLSLDTWMLGYPDRATQMLQTTDTHARRRGHPFDLGWVLTLGCWLWDFRCAPASMLVRVEEAEWLGRTHSLPFISEVMAQLWKGVAWLRSGRLAEGIAQLRGALERWDAHGVETMVPYYRAVLATGLALSGDLAGGLRLIEESLSQIARPGWEERWRLAEVLRLKGELMLCAGEKGKRGKGEEANFPDPKSQILDPESEAEGCFLRAIEVAQSQQAKSWELRTATSLARLWQQQGKHHEARTMLSEVYNWFTEGFETKDLQEAKALMEELSH